MATQKYNGPQGRCCHRGCTKIAQVKVREDSGAVRHYCRQHGKAAKKKGGTVVARRD